MTEGSLARALEEAVGFAPQGGPVGNLTLGRGTLHGRALRVARVENRTASGSIGVAEGERLAALFRVVARERSPLVLFLDSAGAKVSEGLRALGAFRALFRAGLEALWSGAPIAALIGKNCYGGASMVAHLAGRRLLDRSTPMAMSGPAILAAAAGASATDEMFLAMAQVALSPAARSRANAENAVWEPGMDVAAWLREALSLPQDPIASVRARHEALAGRFEKGRPDGTWEGVHRRDLDRIYVHGYEARESDGLLDGRAERDGSAEAFIGLVGNAPLGAARAWRFAQRVWQQVEDPPPRLEVFLDCASHAARLDDEKIVLTEYVTGMSFALAALAASGTRVGLTVLGHAGGGVYVALAAPAQRVTTVDGAEIHVLPRAAVAAILGQVNEAIPDFEDYSKAGVADAEIKLGWVG